jgi:hypothetical protein
MRQTLSNGANQSELSKRHWESLTKQSAIAEALITGRGYATVTSDDPRLDPFSESQRRDGLWIPGHTVWGDRNAGQLRPDEPRVVKGRELKYETPHGSISYLDIHPLMLDRVRNTTDGIVITEGVKKADSLSSRGVPTIALTGVWNFRGKIAPGKKATRELPDFDAIPWKARTVIIAYDSDLAVNPDVQRAQNRLAALLAKRGAKVYLFDWEKVFNGGQ